MFSYFLVRGHSMEPSAKEGDFVFVWKLFFRPKEGDMVVFLKPASQELFLKRVARVGRSACWLEGDNKQDSKDSRQFGWVPKQAILGRASIIRKGSSLTG